MVDAGYGFFVGDERQTTHVMSPYSAHVEVNATVGYQVYPFLFLGVGAGYHGYKKDINGKQFTMIPVYGDVRIDFLRSTITPFIDFRVGYGIGDGPFKLEDSNLGSHLFMCPAIGGRIALNRRLALHAKLGVTLQRSGCRTIAYESSQYMHTLTILGGIEF